MLKYLQLSTLFFLSFTAAKPSSNKPVVCTFDEESNASLDEEQRIECRKAYRIVTCAIQEDETRWPDQESQDACILANRKACLIDDNMEPLFDVKKKNTCIHEKRRQDMNSSFSLFLGVLLCFILIAFCCFLITIEKQCQCLDLCRCCRRKDTRVGIDEEMAVESPNKNKITPISPKYEQVQEIELSAQGNVQEQSQ